jgi:sugar O-acyltransferase (sialic acid O-acetyltransferase NeuD family)
LRFFVFLRSLRCLLLIDMNKPKIILIGGGGHCRSCIDVIESENRFEIAGIVEKDNTKRPPVLGYPVLGSDQNLAAYLDIAEFALVTVGQLEDSESRVNLFALAQNLGFKLPTILSPHAVVSPHSEMGAGSIVMHHAVVNAGAKIGQNCILNSKSLVEHDARVGDHCHISTGAILNGDVRVGDRSFIGSNAVVVQGVTIPPDSFIKASALIKRNH